MGLIIEKLKYETAERGRNQYCLIMVQLLKYSLKKFVMPKEAGIQKG